MEQPTDVQDVRVAHFGLGPLGAAIARVVSERAGLTSVAAYDPSGQAAGRGLGDILGIGATDVVVETSADSLRDLEADVVLFVPDGDLNVATTELEMILESGLNVIAILPELAYPPDEEDDDLAVSVDTLAREAEVTALALDPADALLGTIPLTLTGICSRVDRLTVRRRGVDVETGHLSLGDWARSLAETLGWALDDFDEFEGHHEGVASGHHRIEGRVDDREVLVVETFAGPGQTGETVEVEIVGSPSLTLTLSGNADGERALATLAVNAIPGVLAGDPGLYALADLPPVHYWTSLGLMPANPDADEDDEE